MLTVQHRHQKEGHDGGNLQGGADHRLLDRHRPRDGGAPRRQGLDGLRDRAPAGVDRRTWRQGLQARSRSTSPTRRRCRRRSRAVEAGRGRGRRARQQRRLQPDRRGRERAARRRPPPVRDQRVRARAHVPARAARHARAGLGQDRQRQLDGRQADVPRRRHLPRHQARGRGDQRRAALRGARLRRRRGRDRAGPDQHAVRRNRRRQRSTTGTADDGPYAEFNAAVAKATAGVYDGPARAGSAAAPRRWRARSRRRSRGAGRGPATRSRRPRA